MDERQLLRRARGGDRDALEALCAREWRPVYALLYHDVANSAEAQDLTQEVFLRALRALERFEGGDAPFGAYLATIARNLLRDRWRRKAPILVALDGIDEAQLARPAPTDRDDPLARLLADAERDRLRQALDALPPDYRTVIRLRVLDGRPTPEVADLMARSPDAIRQLQRRALVALRTALREETRR